MARSPSSFPVTVSLWLDASYSFSAIPFRMIDTVWLVPVFLIPGADSLPFCCRLLLVFVDTVFMRLGALTVSLQFVGSVDCMAWPCLPRPWPFLFCHLALVGSRHFSRLPSCPTLLHVGELLAMPRLFIACFWRLSLFLLSLVAKSGFPSIPFLTHSWLHLALTLRQAWALPLPSVRSGLPVSITIPGGSFIMEAFLLTP